MAGPPGRWGRAAGRGRTSRREARGRGRRPRASPEQARDGRATTSDTLATVDGTRAAGIALVVVSAIAFGSGGLFAKPVYATGVDWLTLMAWRFAIGGALAWLVLLARPSARRALQAIPRRTLLGAIGLGVLYVGNTATYYAGLEAMTARLSALIVYLYPPVVAVLALRLGRPLEGRRAWSRSRSPLSAWCWPSVASTPTPPARLEDPADPRGPDHLRRLDHPGGASLRRAQRDRRARRR